MPDHRTEITEREASLRQGAANDGGYYAAAATDLFRGLFRLRGKDLVLHGR